MVPGLTRGDFGAAFIAEPFLSQVRLDVRLFAKAFDAIAKSFLISSCFTSRAWLAQNPGIARRLVQVMDETALWANAHHDDTAGIISKDTRIPLEVVRAMNRVRYSPLQASLLQPVLNAAVKYKAIDRPVNATDIVAKLPA